MALCLPWKPHHALSIPLQLIALLLLAVPVLARGRHVVAFRSPGLRPSSLLWDPVAQHFLVGSRRRPAATAVSDAGVLDTVITDADLSEGSSLPSLALDSSRRRLLAVVAPATGGSSPAYLAAYDLRSARPHRRLFLSPLPSSADAADVAVDPATGAAYVTSSSQNTIWKVDPEGVATIFSRSEAFGKDGHRGLGGIAHVGKGYLLTVQMKTGKVFKVDAEDGTVKTVLIGGTKGVVDGAERIAVRADGSAAVAGGRAAQILTSDDGWGEAAVYDGLSVVAEGARTGGVAVREGRRVYVLIVEEEDGSLGSGEEGGDRRYRIEELEWEREEEGEWVVGLVLLGLGLAYFLYWRFQMGRLVGDMNKKRL